VTTTTKGAQPVTGSRGSLGGGRLRLRCRGMRRRLARWLPTIVSIRCYVQGCAWCFSADGVLQLCGDGGRRGVFLLVTSGDALPSASAFRLRPPRGRLCWSLLRLLPGGCARALLSFRWSPWDPGGRTHATSSCGWWLPSGSHIIKSLSVFQIKNNQISRDVKGLFLGHRFVWSRVIVKVPMLQLEDELLGKGRGNVRYQGLMRRV
jgi:hypothetical protein